MPLYIGTTVKEEKGIEPYIVSPCMTSPSSTSTVAISPLDEKRGTQHGQSRTTIRSNQSSDRPHYSHTSSFGDTSSSRVSGGSGTGVNTLNALQSTLGSSLLFSNTTSRDNGDEEEEPMALSHEELARVFDRVTELRTAQSLEAPDRAVVLARRQPEALEKLARQIAGVD
ncbi:hypothetical protein FRC18_003684 [Serendipita sp. 400]|nr:hypothetical protein FRC18_003684 [Serendipita sp. 400]